jgi:hypothetical protein
MGATVIVYWPGITEEQLEAQPGFYNDDHAWGNWIAEREEEPEVLQAIRRLNADAILTFTTEGVEDTDVQWVTPEQLREAVKRLREAIRANHPETRIILETYERNANGDDPVAEAFLRDLGDLEAMTYWAEEEGASRMTLEVNW